MAILLTARLVPVNCAQLQLGMYVAELDRSWLETAFHSHGFLINLQEQISELRRCCEYVYVDPVLSEHGDGEMFSTGLTGRVEALVVEEAPSVLKRNRQDLRELGHVFATAVQRIRRSEALVLAPLRHGAGY